MAQKLRNLVVKEISLVDRPANPGARVLLAKRADDEPYWKREFSADERDAAASSGAAMPDGSFPIKTTGDLKNAIQAIGRAKNPGKAKAHIISRARSLGASDMLPDDWKTKKRADVASLMGFFRKYFRGADIFKDAGDSVDFNEALDTVDAQECAQEMLSEIYEAFDALRLSVGSILGDDAVKDKQAMLDTSFEQFKEHLGGLVPSEMTKALAAGIAAITAGDPVGATDKGDPMSAALKKALGLADNATDADVEKAITSLTGKITKLEGDLALAKMSDAHKSYMDGLSGDAKDKFAAKSAPERDQHMKDNPVKKAEVPEAVQKALDQQAETIRKQGAELDELRKREELATFTKRAADLGLNADAAAHLLTINKADPKALEAVEKVIKGLTEQVKTGKVFAEFGTSQGSNADTATAKVAAKVAELRKADPKIREDTAIAKIAGDPANRELWEAYKAESRQPKAA